MIDLISQRDHLLERRSSANLVTTKKIQEIALYILTGAAFIGGAILLGQAVFVWGFTIAIPLSLTLLSIGTVSFLVSRDLIDYEDKEELDHYRQEIKHLVDLLEEEERESGADLKAEVKLILKNCIDKHGFKNMLQYGIPHPHDFRRIWEFIARHMDLKEVIDLYGLVSAEYQRIRDAFPTESYPFDIPLPRDFKEKWNYENYCEEIAEVFDPRILKGFGIIESGEYQMLRLLKREYLVGKKTYEDRTVNERKAIDDLIKGFEKKRNKDHEIVNKRFREHPAKQALRKLRSDKVNELHLLYRNMQVDREIQEAQARYLSMKKELKNTGRDAAFEMEKKHFRRVQAAVQARFAPFKKHIERRFNEQKKLYAADIALAEMERDREVTLINRRYEEKTGEITRRFEEACFVPLRTFNELKASLNRRWREYRARVTV
jgi:hypothetical protein